MANVSKNFKPRDFRHGFTLAEILVVIAIIAILSAILFPAFSRSRASGQRSSCQSNLKQIYLGMAQYLSDSDDSYPLPDTRPESRVSYATFLQPYLKSKEIFVCPSTSANKILSVDPDPADTSDYLWEANGIIGSYSMNGSVANLHSSKIPFPSQTVLFIDNRVFMDFQFLNHLQYCARHFGGYNVSYVDGHVKWCAAGQQSNLVFRTF